MNRYIQRNVEVKAFQMPPDDNPTQSQVEALHDWFGSINETCWASDRDGIELITPHGSLNPAFGQWIVYYKGEWAVFSDSAFRQLFHIIPEGNER